MSGAKIPSAKETVRLKISENSLRKLAACLIKFCSLGANPASTIKHVLSYPCKIQMQVK